MHGDSEVRIMLVDTMHGAGRGDAWCPWRVLVLVEGVCTVLVEGARVVLVESMHGASEGGDEWARMLLVQR